MFFKKKSKSTIEIPARISRMSLYDLTSWGDLLIIELGKAYERWNLKKGSAKEVTETLDAVNQIWAELEKRKA